ncbi:MAG: cytochrome c biogenesis protein CcsA [Pseudomonadota bacterium]
MLAFTIFAAYLGTGLWLIRPFRSDSKDPEQTLRPAVVVPVVALIALHGAGLTGGVILNPDIGLGLADVLSIIAWLFAAIGLFAALQPGFGVLAGIVFCLSAALIGGSLALPGAADQALTWQLKLHAVLSLIAYSFLAAGAVLAAASLVQDAQLRAARVSRLSAVLPPLLATEKLLATLTTSGFVFLLLAITSGFVFVENLFAQHLTHKSALSVGALAIFGLLVIGRQVSGWRGRRMLQLYLTGFLILVLAYFGSKIVLEFLLDRSWG